MNTCLVSFNGISDVDVVKAALINDLSKPSEGITREIKSVSSCTKVTHSWWNWKALLEREHQTLQVLEHGCKNLVSKTWKMISTMSACFPSHHRCHNLPCWEQEAES